MKWNRFIPVIITGCMIIQAKACVDVMSSYSAGVVFSNGEAISTQNIEKHCRDTLSYIKNCTVGSGETGQKITIGTIDSKPADQLTIHSAWVTMNMLHIVVSYGGGCKVHEIGMYTDGKPTASIPGKINLMLTHNSNEDNCKAIVSDTLVFRLDGICECNGIELSIFAPGSSNRYEPAPTWNQYSGLKTIVCSYKLRSAYSPDVMTYIGVFNGYGSNGTENYKQLTVVFDTSEPMPTASQKIAAVLAELDRMQKMEVLKISETQQKSIETQLTTSQGQYWTAEDTVLLFNQWFENNAITGVKGVYGVRGCGSIVDYQLPEKPIEYIASVTKPVEISHAVQRITVIHTSVSGVSINFTGSKSNSHIVLSDMKGRVLESRCVTPGQNNLLLGAKLGKQLSCGIYLVSIIENGSNIQTVSCSVLH